MRRRVGGLALGLGLAAFGAVAFPAVAHAEEWRAGERVPTGYHVERPKTGGTLVGVGLGNFAVGYVPTAALGGIGVLLCATWGSCTPSPARLLIPVAGPFIFGSTDPLLVISGLVQTGGASWRSWAWC